MSSNNPFLDDKEPMGSSDIDFEDNFVSVELDQFEDGELEDFGDIDFERLLNKRSAYGLEKRKRRNLCSPFMRCMLLLIFLASFVLVVIIVYKYHQGSPSNLISSSEKQSQGERSTSYSPVSPHSHRSPVFDKQKAIDKALTRVHEGVKDQFNQKFLNRWNSRNDRPGAYNKDFRPWTFQNGRHIANADKMGIAPDFRSKFSQGMSPRHTFSATPSRTRESGNPFRSDSVTLAPRSITPVIEDSTNPRLEVNPRFNKRVVSDTLKEKMVTVENKENQHIRHEIVQERSPKKGPISSPPSIFSEHNKKPEPPAAVNSTVDSKIVKERSPKKGPISSPPSILSEHSKEPEPSEHNKEPEPSEHNKKPQPPAAGNSTVDSKTNSVPIREKSKKTNQANGKEKKKSDSDKSH